MLKKWKERFDYFVSVVFGYAKIITEIELRGNRISTIDFETS